MKRPFITLTSDFGIQSQGVGIMEAVAREISPDAHVIHINKFGSLHLNIRHEAWDRFSVKKNQKLMLAFGKQNIELPFVETFGDVPRGKPLVLKDDYGRMEVAINMSSFAEAHKIQVGDACVITRITASHKR